MSLHRTSPGLLLPDQAPFAKSLPLCELTLLFPKMKAPGGRSPSHPAYQIPEGLFKTTQVTTFNIIIELGAVCAWRYSCYKIE